MPIGRGYHQQDCSLARALEVVGERWTLLVLRDCLFGVTHFSDLRARLDIPRAVLSERLALLVAEGLLQRHQERGEYHPTTKALDLWPAIQTLREWGERHYAAPGGPRRIFRHLPCAADLDPSGHCPACGTRPPPAELEVRPGPGADLTLRADPVTRALDLPHRLLTPLP